MDATYLVQHNDLWHVVEQEHGRARIYQLETKAPEVRWTGLAAGETPVIEMGGDL